MIPHEVREVLFVVHSARRSRFRPVHPQLGHRELLASFPSVHSGHRPMPVSAPPLDRKDLLDFDACTECGRCTAVCPANRVGKVLSPRDIILDLQKLSQAPHGDFTKSYIGGRNPAYSTGISP